MVNISYYTKMAIAAMVVNRYLHYDMAIPENIFMIAGFSSSY